MTDAINIKWEPTLTHVRRDGSAQAGFHLPSGLAVVLNIAPGATDGEIIAAARQAANDAIAQEKANYMLTRRLQSISEI